jgi:hypothetical protein
VLKATIELVRMSAHQIAVGMSRMPEEEKKSKLEIRLRDNFNWSKS